MAAECKNLVCVVDCSGETDHTTAARLLSDLTGNSSVDCSQTVDWAVSNKYYEAEISVEVRTELETSRGDNWEALIALCNLTQPLSLKSAYKVWEGLNSEATPPVNLLVGVVSGCGSVEEVKSEVVKWCLGRGVELVIWNSDSPPKPPEEDDFPESVGVVRVSEALQAHMWPSMELKDGRQSGLTPAPTDCSHSNGGGGGGVNTGLCGNNEKVGNLRSDCCNGSSEAEADLKVDQSSFTSNHTSLDPSSQATPISDTVTETQTISAAPSDSASSDARLDSLLGVNDGTKVPEGTEDDGEEFERLFAKFADMKAHAQSLPQEERKDYAEKVVMSFLKAIGGNNDEIGSENDSDHETS